MELFSNYAMESERLEPNPFKMELNMESYIAENPAIISMDDDDIPEILDYEIPLKNGRENGDGRMDLIARYAGSTIAVIELKLGIIDKKAKKQLEEYLLNKKEIIEGLKKNNKIDEEKDPNVIGILIGQEIDSELEAEITSDEQNSIIAFKINRFKTRNNQNFIVSNLYSPKKNRDYSKFSFDDKSLGKGQLVVSCVKKYIENNNPTYEELKEHFDSIRPKTILKADEISNKKRYEIITLCNGNIEIGISKDWGNPFEEVYKKLIKDFPEIQELQ